MSHNFFKFIKLFTTNKNIKFEPFLLAFTIPNIIYAVSTQKEENIVITNKYKFVTNGFTNFMIVDDKGAHFNVNNSFWFWKWDSIEDWHNLKIGDNIYAKYYGFRIPFLSCFPNIVNTKYKSILINEKSTEESIEDKIDSAYLVNKSSDSKSSIDSNYSKKVIASMLATFK